MLSHHVSAIDFVEYDCIYFFLLACNTKNISVCTSTICKKTCLTGTGYGLLNYSLL